MPKLPKKKAESVAKAESDFPLLPEGKYAGTLKEVKVSAQPGPSGEHYWQWVFTNLIGLGGDEVEVGKKYKGQLSVFTSLADNAEWKMNEVFAAFGYTPDSDTDEMCGETIAMYVAQREQEVGKRKGQVQNVVDKCVPYDADNPDAEDEF